MACGRPGRHFVPPSFGEPGFFACTEMLDGAEVVARDPVQRAIDQSMQEIMEKGYTVVDSEHVSTLIDYRE